VALAAELVRWLGLVFGRVLRDIGGARLILLAKVVGKFCATAAPHGRPFAFMAQRSPWCGDAEIAE